jgi:putative DNA primase/helicase
MTDAPKPYDDAGLRRAGFKLDRAHRYVDPDGKVVREKLRYGRIKNGEREKTFRWRHQNGSGEWLFGQGDAPHFLFGRDLLLAYSAEEKPEVFVCESEKVAEDLHKRGLAAVAVGTSWDDVEDLELLRDRDCLVLVDKNDDGKGEENAFKAARAVHGIARTIRLVRKPGPPDAQNLADDIGGRLTLEQFLQECRWTSPLPVPKDDGDNQNEEEVILRFERMSDVEPEPVDFLWPGRIARKKLTLLAGDPGMGKSLISLDVAAPEERISLMAHRLLLGVLWF